MYLKIHPTPQGSMVAVCDSELIGKVLSDRKRHLDLAAYSSFYQGKKANAAQVASALRKAQNANLVGKKALKAAKSAGIDISSAIEISGIPHLQAYGL